MSFLEEHPDYFSSSHNYSTYHEDTKELERRLERFDNLTYDVWDGEEYHAFNDDDYKNDWFLFTLATVRRNIKFIDDEVMSQYPIFFDYIKFYYMIKMGKCAFFKKEMATYRIHKGGISSGSNIITLSDNYLKNCYVLLRLEDDNSVIPGMNRSFVNLVIQLLIERKFKRAYGVLIRHNKEISFKNTVSCIYLITRRLVEILYNRLTK